MDAPLCIEEEKESEIGSCEDEEINSEFYNLPTRRAERYVTRNRSLETPITGKLRRELKRLEASYNPDARVDNLSDLANFANINIDSCLYSAVTSGYLEPSNYKEMMKRPKNERHLWLKGMKEEMKKMNTRSVWKKIKRSLVPKNRRLLRCKWVYKLKRNGVYRSRLVAMGFSQIPGIDFTDSFSPVVGDVTVRVVLILALIFGWESLLIDVENAFLYGDLDKEIYMEVPEGMVAEKD